VPVGACFNCLRRLIVRLESAGSGRRHVNCADAGSSDVGMELVKCRRMPAAETTPVPTLRYGVCVSAIRQRAMQVGMGAEGEEPVREVLSTPPSGPWPAWAESLTAATGKNAENARKRPSAGDDRCLDSDACVTDAPGCWPCLDGRAAAC
jgi:hypothetical protein